MRKVVFVLALTVVGVVVAKLLSADNITTVISGLLGLVVGVLVVTSPDKS